MFFIKISLIITCIILLTLSSFADNTTNETLIVTLKVNYIDSDDFSIILKNNKNELLVPIQDIKPFSIKDEYLETAAVNLHDIKYVNLALLKEINYRLNDETLTLDINFPAEHMQLQRFSAITEPSQQISGTPISGAFLNYDITFIDNSDSKSLAGFQDFNYFSKYGVLTTSFIARSSPLDSGFKRQKHLKRDYNNLTRLESNWTFDNVETIARWRIGDSITKAADWSNSTRFFGLQYATNFAVRPNLITRPLLEFAGRSELPSSIDVYANAASIYHGESKIGDFDIANLPVITGRGDLVVKTRDITGKIQTITIPYYAAPILLRKGLSSFSFESGVQRKNFALKSNQYQYFLTNADYMHGITDNWTSGVHFESLKTRHGWHY